VLWPNDTCVKHEKREAVVMRHTFVIRLVAIVWQDRREYPQGFEALVPKATDSLGDRFVLIVTRKKNMETNRMSAIVRGIAGRAVAPSHREQPAYVTNGTVKLVNRTKGWDISAIFNN